MSAKLDFIFPLFKLSYVINGPLGNPEHTGTDLKKVLLEKIRDSKIRDGICKQSQTQVIIRRLHGTPPLIHLAVFLRGEGGMLSIL